MAPPWLGEDAGGQSRGAGAQHLLKISPKDFLGPNMGPHPTPHSTGRPVTQGVGCSDWTMRGAGHLCDELCHLLDHGVVGFPPPLLPDHRAPLITAALCRGKEAVNWRGRSSQARSSAPRVGPHSLTPRSAPHMPGPGHRALGGHSACMGAGHQAAGGSGPFSGQS